LKTEKSTKSAEGARFKEMLKSERGTMNFVFRSAFRVQTSAFKNHTRLSCAPSAFFTQFCRFQTASQKLVLSPARSPVSLNDRFCVRESQRSGFNGKMSAVID
jgi:hypothetical protein